MNFFNQLFGKKNMVSDSITFTDQVRRFAEEAVDASRDRGGATLDYSEASLTIIDELLEEISLCGAAVAAESMSTIFSSYILEVARRQFGGKYSWHERGNQPVLVVGEPHFRIAIITLDRVKKRMHGDRESNIPFFFEGFSNRVRGAKAGDDALYV